MRALLAIACLTFCGLANAASLYVAEFKSASPVTYPAAETPANAEQKITFTSTSVQSAAFAYQTTIIRVQADATCHVVIAANPTATVNSAIRLIAGQTEYFTVKAGDKIAVIAE